MVVHSNITPKVWQYFGRNATHRLVIYTYRHTHPWNESETEGKIQNIPSFVLKLLFTFRSTGKNGDIEFTRFKVVYRTQIKSNFFRLYICVLYVRIVWMRVAFFFLGFLGLLAFFSLFSFLIYIWFVWIVRAITHFTLLSFIFNELSTICSVQIKLANRNFVRICGFFLWLTHDNNFWFFFAFSHRIALISVTCNY